MRARQHEMDRPVRKDQMILAASCLLYTMLLACGISLMVKGQVGLGGALVFASGIFLWVALCEARNLIFNDVVKNKVKNQPEATAQ